MAIEREIQEKFTEIDSDSNGFLSREELQTASQSNSASVRLVADALTSSFDWLKNLSNDEYFSESEISFPDIGNLSKFEVSSNRIQSLETNFSAIDLDKNGFISESEVDRVGASINMPAARTALAETIGQYHIFRRMSGLSNDEWGLESEVSLADVRVYREAREHIARMNTILRSRDYTR
jgi:Ca2+-binding EF-hand superfamily protein